VVLLGKVLKEEAQVFLFVEQAVIWLERVAAGLAVLAQVSLAVQGKLVDQD
jgi:hypothetical protein